MTKEISGDLIIRTLADAKAAKDVVSVGGSVYMDISAEGAQLPALAKVGGSVYISAEGAQLPALTECGSVYISAEGAQLPALAKVGGSVVAQRDIAIAAIDKVREIILDNKARLAMDHWHSDMGWRERSCAEEATCGTTHCLAGWLQVCSTDPAMRDLEPQVAGMIIAPVAAPMFFTSNKRALKWLQEREYAA